MDIEIDPVVLSCAIRFMSPGRFFVFSIFAGILFSSFPATSAFASAPSNSQNGEKGPNRCQVLPFLVATSSSPFVESSPGYTASQLKSLLALARSPSPASRARAIEGLKHFDTDDVNYTIVMALIDPEAEVREAAFNATRAWDDDRLCKSLIRAYSSNGDEIQHGYDQVLPLFSLKLATPFKRILVDPSASSRDRCIAAHCLGVMRVQDAVKVLADAVWLNDDYLATEGAWALVRVGSPESVPDFVRMTYHASKEVRHAAIEGLGRISTPASLRALESIASDRQVKDRDIRREAVLWLGMIGDNQTVDTLVSILRNEPFLRRTATQALRRLTGLPFGDAPREWYEWYANYRQSTQPQTSSPSAPPPLVPRGVVLPAVPPGFVPGNPAQTEEQQKKKP